MPRFLCLLVWITLLLLCNTPSAWGANLRQRRKRQQRLEQLATKKKNICPISLPENGSTCRRHPKLVPCAYEFVQVPTANKDGSCSGSLTCAPTVQCSCHEKTWECTNVPSTTTTTDTCEGDLPLDSYHDCSPDGKMVVDTPEEDKEESDADVEHETNEDVFVHINTTVDETCPTVMPPSGSKCTRRSELGECPFEFTNVPVYEADGTCQGAVSCLPLGGCNCFDGVWDCYTASVRRCRGDMPLQAFEQCQLP
mmetsp:Transcript_8099/g.16301  ORF Transcript_8099/g.16301 Transcript_8099/m.16301 type:complete len:253 (+) Transcript_8099:118-876(+)